jgi:hypothetical protein
VADVLRCDVEVLERVLARAPGVLPGAIEGAAGWEVPERALRSILGAAVGPLPVFATVNEVAECLRVSPKTVYGWLKVRRADGSALLPHRRVLGAILIEAAAVLRLPERMPRAGLSLFFQREGSSDE